MLMRPRRMDVHEDTQNNVVTASFELPGLSKEHVSIDVHQNTLTVSGESVVAKPVECSSTMLRSRSSHWTDSPIFGEKRVAPPVSVSWRVFQCLGM